jgi:hypothetical protein
VAHEVIWAQSAVDGLLEAVEFIAKDSPSYAAALASRADVAANSLKICPIVVIVFESIAIRMLVSLSSVAHTV